VLGRATVPVLVVRSPKLKDDVNAV